MADWYTIDEADQPDTPALVIYPGRVKHNIDLLKSQIDDISRLRVHVKTHKSSQATQLLLDADITKFKCATIAEAEMLGQCQAPDVLLAYQPVGPKQVRFAELIKKYSGTSFSCLIDNLHTAQNLSNQLVEAGIKAGVYIDLNVGMNRTGITPDDNALQLYIACSQLQGLQVEGLHAYDGHLHQLDFEERAKACEAAFTPVWQLQEAIVQQGLSKPAVIAGGSPTFPVHAKREGVECSPGTFIYWDWGYTQELPEQPYLPAALVISRVVSVPSATQVCLDAGHKAIGAENPLNKRIRFLNASDLIINGHSEEHLMAETRKPHHLKVGDILYGLPWHICPTVALYDYAFIIENGKVTGEWKTTARNRKITV